MSGRRKGGTGQSGSFAGWKSQEAANCSGKPGARRLRRARARNENLPLYKLARMCYFQCMESYQRTHSCGELTAADIGKKVILNGWVFKLRNHGGLFFINLRDRFGVTQTVIDDSAPERLRGTAASLKFECCIAVCGTVRQRPDSMVNPQMATGEIEVAAEEIVLLNSCDTLPFMIDEEETQAKEDLRLRYRFLDLRSGGMQSRIALRHKTAFAVREFLNGEGFFEIETPTFIKSTPEGARDFLVPSRIHKGKFYALPQSPQLYKQLLMVSGFDKYFQIARCYRDEDARGDRQPEFTQIDMEMSFVSAEDVYSVTERMMKHVFKKALNVDLPTPFPRIPYAQAMNLYGSDKPELRFDMTFVDFTEAARNCSFSVFRNAVEAGGTVKLLIVPGAAEAYSRKKISELEEVAKIYGAPGLAWMKATENGLEGGISKFFENNDSVSAGRLGFQAGDLLLFSAGPFKTAVTALGAVRLRLGKDLGLIDPNRFSFCWINDFPLFEWNEEEQKWDPAHHMFTMPKEKYLATMEENPGEVIGDLYDLVCNGYELASGSIRIHDPAIQKRIFKIVGFSEEQAEEKFGFLLNAFRYGAPPHGGIAPGLDRLVMIMAGKDSIKEVIAFPKNNVMASPMDDSPSPVDAAQLKELGLSIDEREP